MGITNQGVIPMNGLKKFYSVFGVLALGLMTAGCRDAGDMAAEIERLTSSEERTYQRALTASSSGERGEVTAQVLQDWGTAVQALDRRLSDLSRRLREHPEERSRIPSSFYTRLR
jgi:hypothetical protein